MNPHLIPSFNYKYDILSLQNLSFPSTTSGAKKKTVYCRYGCGFLVEGYLRERDDLLDEHYRKAHRSEAEKKKKLFNSSRQITIDAFLSDIWQYDRDGEYFGKPVRIEMGDECTLYKIQELESKLKGVLGWGLHPEEHPLGKPMYVLVSNRTCKCGRKMIVIPCWISNLMRKGKKRTKRSSLVELKHGCPECKILTNNRGKIEKW